LWNDKRGFIFMEVVVAILIFGISVIPATMAMVAVSRQSEGAGKRFVALELAQGKFEEVSGNKYEEIAPEEKKIFAAPYDGYQYAVEVREDDVYSGYLKNICVTVYYTEPGTGRERTVTITGARAKR
jgi:Tfp pilus assembly protein PilV